MLTSLKIENFKNFQEEQQLIFSNEDLYNFTILVGKNGAGLTFHNLQSDLILHFLHFSSFSLLLATRLLFICVSPF